MAMSFVWFWRGATTHFIGQSYEFFYKFNFAAAKLAAKRNHCDTGCRNFSEAIPAIRCLSAFGGYLPFGWAVFVCAGESGH